MSYAENTRRLMPLCDVLYGKVGDFLSWCRQENASGKTFAHITAPQPVDLSLALGVFINIDLI